MISFSINSKISFCNINLNIFFFISRKIYL